MPEKEITKSEAESVVGWVYRKRGKRVRELYGYYLTGIWTLKEEPLVILNKNFPRGFAPVDDPLEYLLFCSDKHAKGLEKAEVVKF